jgi:hypothetical protein
MVTYVAIAQQQKLAQTGMKFLSLTTDARGGAMGDAMTTLDCGSSSMFFNPATMAWNENFGDVALNRTNWIAGINYISGSASFTPLGSSYGVIGIFFTSVDYGGDFYGTVLADNTQGFKDIGNLSPSTYAVGISYARTLSNKFAIGGNVKIAYQNLGSAIVDLDANGGYIKQDFKTSVTAFDFGMLYKTGYKSLVFGMSIRNFSREVTYVQESFQLPLTFKVGISMNLMDVLVEEKSNNSLLLAVDAVQPRDYPQQLSIGAEYGYSQRFFLRAGVFFPNDNYTFNAGVGVKQPIGGVTVGIDYAYTPFQKFDSVHRFTVNFIF